MTHPQPTPDQRALAERIADEILAQYPHVYPDQQPWAREQIVKRILPELTNPDFDDDEAVALAHEAGSETILESWANSDQDADDEHRDEDYSDEDDDHSEDEEDDDDELDDEDDDLGEDDGDCPQCGEPMTGGTSCDRCGISTD